MAGFDYVANLAAVVNAMTDRNTTTSSPDVSDNMTRRVETLRSGDPELEILRIKRFPAVFVKIVGGDEEAASLGDTGPTGSRKFKDVVYRIFGMYKRDGAHTLERVHRTEIYRLAQNIEAVFQDEEKLSNTALWCHPEATDFESSVGGELFKTVEVTLRAKYLFR